MNASRSVPLLIAIVTAASGCLSGLDPTDQLPDGAGGAIPNDWFQYVIPDDPDHDHQDILQHQGLSTPNFEILGWDPLTSEYYGHTAAGTLCGDAADVGDRRLAVVHSLQTDVAFFLIDVTDAAAPVVIGEFVMPQTGSRDVALSADGEHVVIAVPQSTRPETPEAPAADAGRPALLGTRAEWRSICTGGAWVPVAEAPGVVPPSQDDTGYPGGFLLVNVADPTNIFVESSLPGPALGGHSVTVSDVNGESIIIGSVTNLASPASYWYFMDILETPAGAQLNLLSTYSDPPSPTTGAPINGHNDGWVQVHPVTGQTLAYLAAWHQGAIIVDISNPRAPQKIGQWTDAETVPILDPDGDAVDDNLVQDGRGNIHEVIPLEGTWDGKHYVFIGQEILTHPSNSPTGWMRVLDTTDPTNPLKIADWTLPLDISWGDTSAVFSTHYVTIHERTLFMANYHAGVWAVDLTNLGTEEFLPTIGAFVPANQPPTPAPEHTAYTWAPTIMDVDALANGDLVVFDSWSGVYVVRFDTTNPAPPAYPFTDY